ncbi:cyanophycinase [Galbibacter mesophilus]|uniref:cyanophycinase n=1 Tax=Galbibacter mesophilus TaxID=379069 RepID=UPI001F5C186A|nr:cyanophycinase [Galbibacter mesophilus]MCM5661435.1 cyanophycinase [Galbibacter mesophilus]
MDYLRMMFLMIGILVISCSSGGEDETQTTPEPDPPVASKDYVSYVTGSETDKKTTPKGGICLMGGATENDRAMKWFLNRADGGDVLVLRTSGSDGYNNYMFSELGVDLNSVETIVCKNAKASDDDYLHTQINNAEAIWFAGGDQWDYVSFWRDTKVAELINKAITERNIVIGGTSAGMAIQGGFYYSAQRGSVKSDEALMNPYNQDMTIGNEEFIDNKILAEVITDTHYDNPDRKGRHVAFLARIRKDNGVAGKGIACDEYTSVCIDEKGLATIYGGAPDYDDNAYFIQPNPEIENNAPEVCEDGEPLEWNKNSKALKVYAVKGTNDGNHTFNLNDWQTANGGEWQYWYVENGELKE